MIFKCPVCKGKGSLEEPEKHKINKSVTNRVMARLLKKDGYSVRQIMRFMNYKSPNSIQRYFS